MANKIPVRSRQNIYQHPANSEILPRPLSGVRQDKYALKRVRTASDEAVILKTRARPRPKNTKSPRTQNYSKKRQTVQVAAWVKPPIRAELERLAKQEGLSVSATIAALLEEAIRQQLHIQHAVLLQPIIENAIRAQMRSYSNRIAILLVCGLFAGEQTRSLVTNILGRQPGVTQPVLEQILNGSSHAAKRKITQLTPQLERLVKEVKRWMEEGEKTHA